MLYKSFLTFVDGTEASARRLATAAAMAERHAAHLTAVALVRHPSFHIGYQSVAASKVYFEELEAAHEKARALSDAAGESLRAAGRSGDVRWGCDTATGLAEIAAIHARYADLTLLGQPGENDADASLDESVIGGVLFESGRPAVVIPRAWDKGAFGLRILIAWDPVREAARALAGALPFIAEAKYVTIAMVDPEPDERRYGDEPGADLATALSRHGAEVVVDRLSGSDTSTAEAIRKHAATVGSDMIVMGGYGHSMWRESLVGGMTHAMVRDTEVPILLAH